MDVSLESSVVALTIQWVGVLLVAVLSLLLTQSTRRRFLDYWALGWGCLAVGLSALLAAFVLPLPARLFQPLYFFGGFAFGHLFWAGCRCYATGKGLGRRDAWVAAGGAALAVALPARTGSFEALFLARGALLVGLWVLAYAALGPARLRPQGLGLQVVSVALVLLVLLHLHYLPVFAYAGLQGRAAALDYLKYAALYDLILEVLLAFGAVMTVMESVQAELEEANRELAAAGARLQVLAERDPLTQALNRHAFYSLVERRRHAPAAAGSGCVAVLDLDRFKGINDAYGHAAGDAAIRAVARAVRAQVRADDLLFRWGGDEFLVWLPGVGEAEVHARLGRVNAALAACRLPGAPGPVALGVSVGVAPFRDAADLEKAIERADQEMYQAKQARRAADRGDRLAPP